jgi:hypothetical protein
MIVYDSYIDLLLKYTFEVRHCQVSSLRGTGLFADSGLILGKQIRFGGEGAGCCRPRRRLTHEPIDGGLAGSGLLNDYGVVAGEP